MGACFSKHPNHHGKSLKTLAPPHDEPVETEQYSNANTVETTVFNTADVPLFTCDICVESRLLSDSFNVDGCVHFYCTQCIVNYVASKLDDNVTSIRCPVPACDRGVLGPDYCRLILPKKLFNRWGTSLCESAIDGVSKFYCPYKDCSALSILEGGEVEIKNSLCTVCGRDICARCKTPWHDEIDCVKFQKLIKGGEDGMLKDIAKRKKWRRCPNCNFYIQKSNGCNYIICRCGCAFCYNCGTRHNNQSHLCPNCKVFR